MMKKFIQKIMVSGLTAFLLACNANNQPSQPAKSATPALPVSQKNQLSVQAFVDTLAKLAQTAPVPVAQAVELFDVLAPTDSASTDSAAAALFRFINQTAEAQSEKMWKDTANFSPLLQPENNNLSAKQKATLSELHAQKLKLVSDGEGGVYVVPAYETILPTVQGRTSVPVDNFLNLLAKEDTTPVFLDAGLAIELPELADRLVMTEQLLAQQLPAYFSKEIQRLNQYYTRALVMGADNTPSIEHKSTVLAENFKQAYDYLLAKYPGSKAADRIKAWLAVIASGDKAGIDAYRRTLP